MKGTIERTKNEHDDITIASYAELTVTFQFITTVNSCDGHQPEPEKTMLKQRMHIFNLAQRMMEEMLKKRVHPGNKVKSTDALVRLRFAKGPGVEGRPNIPLGPLRCNMIEGPHTATNQHEN